MISYEPLFETMKKKSITSYRLFKLGFPQSNYYAIKRGENISTHTINELCRILQCDVCDIMKYMEDTSRKSKQRRVIPPLILYIYRYPILYHGVNVLF